MSIHMNAKEGSIAEKILLPGDPLRAKYIAENYLADAILVNDVRGAYCYTGEYRGKRISVMGTGMGIPAVMIYVTELCRDYHCRELVRIGTGAGFKQEMQLNDLVLSQACSTYSSINNYWFKGDYAACADFDLLLKAYNKAKELNINTFVGNTICNDAYYRDPNYFKVDEWIKHGIIASEMEAAALYSVAPEFKAGALTIIQIGGGPFLNGEILTSKQRETGLDNLIKLGLETLYA